MNKNQQKQQDVTNCSGRVGYVQFFFILKKNLNESKSIEKFHGIPRGKQST